MPAVYENIISGGVVLDGRGERPRPLDLGIEDGRIARIGPPGTLQGRQRLDVEGRMVAPGFLDMHSHADLILLGDQDTQEKLLMAKIRQGVTTVIVGNCGLGPFPTRPDSEENVELLAAINSWMTPDQVKAGPLTLGGYLDRLESSGTVLNVGTLVPHGPVRMQAVGLSPGSPDLDQLNEMKGIISQALDEGAFGVSTGLIYPPGMYSDTTELEELAHVVADHGRLFTSHVRGSSETLLAAVEELIRIGRASGVQVHHSHMEAVGERFWENVHEMLLMEDQARTDGVRISHDVFLYTRAATMMSAIFPPWSLEGGVPALLKRLQNPDCRTRIQLDIENVVPEWPPWTRNGWPHNLVGAVGWDGILVASVADAQDEAMVGKSLAELSSQLGCPAFDLVADLMIRQNGQVAQFVDQVSGRENQVETLHAILRHDCAAVISDAEDFGRGCPHPAHAGAFAKVLRMVREEQVLELPEAVRRMTSLPASILGIKDRGVIREGAVADLVVFDPEQVSDTASWQQPRAAATGIDHVLISGTAVVGNGVYIGGLAGKILRAAGGSSPC